jgi:hypothetical protein
MNTAALPNTYAAQTRIPSALSLVAKKVMNALVESRARSAAFQLRRYEALMADLTRRQDHSASFLMQSNDLPFKI